jgi:hypothetical protein
LDHTFTKRKKKIKKRKDKNSMAGLFDEPPPLVFVLKDSHERRQ